jgi:glutaredoxin
MSFWKSKRPRDVNPSVVVSIYSKPGCHLCDEAKAQLVKLQSRRKFHLEEVDISRDEKLLAEFETRIPLIWVNGRLVCKYQVDEAALLGEVKRASGETVQRAA